MAPPVVSGATMSCSFGLAPSVLNILPTNRVLVGGLPAATIMDHVPFVNVAPFALCSSLANPATAALTAAALGVLTPGPCLPVLPSPWVPGSPTALVGGTPALSATSVCTCAYGGVIQVLTSASTSADVP